MPKPISVSFPSLIQGVSQQPDSLRFSSQAKAADNVYMSPIDGVIPRHSTNTVAQVTGGDGGSSVLHTIDRDESERYLVSISHEQARVFALDGREFNVFANSAGAIADFSYLDASAALDNQVSFNDWSSGTWTVNAQGVVPLAASNYSGPYGTGTPYRFSADVSAVSAAHYSRSAGIFAEDGLPQMVQCFFRVTSELVPATSIDIGFQKPGGSPVQALARWYPGTNTVTKVLADQAGIVAYEDGWYMVWASFDTASDAGFTAGDTREVWVSIEEDLQTGGQNSKSALIWGLVVLENATTYVEPIPTKLPFKAQSVVDYTFILNTEIQPALGTQTSSGLDANGEALVFVKQIANGTSYTVKITTSAGTEEFQAAVIGQRADGEGYNNFNIASGAVAAWSNIAWALGSRVLHDGVNYVCITAHSGLIEPEVTAGWEAYWAIDPSVTTGVSKGSVAPEAAAVIKALSEIITNNASTVSVTTDVKGAVLHIAGSGGEPLEKVEVWTSKESDRYITALDEEGVETLTDLPTVAPTDFVVKVSGDASEELDDYWVKFVGKETTGLSEGYWEEAAAPGEIIDLAPATMPHQLVRRVSTGGIPGAPGTIYFTFEPGEWADRAVGSDVSNKAPSFISTEFTRTISDIFFHENRLGFLSDQNVILSEAGGYFNFWRSSTNYGIVASDRVDLAASTTEVTKFQSAAAFEGELMVFADNAQWLLTSTDVFAPDTAELKPVLDYRINSRVRPVPVAGSVVFPFKRGDYSGCREVIRRQDGLSFDAPDITVQIPSYISGDIVEMVASPLEEMMVLRTSGLTNGFYVYKWFQPGNERVQSAWYRYTFESGAKVRGVSWIENDLYVLILHSDGLYIEKMEVRPQPVDTGGTYHTRLDRRYRTTDSGATAALVGTDTHWTLPYTVTTDFVAVDAVTGKTHEFTVDTGKAVFTGDLTTADLYIGLPFTWTYTFATPHIKQQQGQGESVDRTGRLQVLYGNLEYEDSAYFRVDVSRTGQAWSYVHTGSPTGEYVLGQANLDSGNFRFPILLRNTEATVSVTSSSPLPARLLSIEWESQFNPRTSRVG